MVIELALDNLFSQGDRAAFLDLKWVHKHVDKDKDWLNIQEKIRIGLNLQHIILREQNKNIFCMTVQKGLLFDVQSVESWDTYDIYKLFSVIDK